MAIQPSNGCPVDLVGSAISSAGIIYRKDSVQMICDILARGKVLSRLDASIRAGIALGLERGIYNRAIDLEEKNNVVASWIIPSFATTYKMTRHLLCEKIAPIDTTTYSTNANCVDPQENSLGASLEQILFDPKRWETLAATPIYELHPNTFSKNIRKISERKYIAVKIKYSDIKCGNCNKYMVREESAQTRSADESSTPYQICDGCNMQIKLCS